MKKKSIKSKQTLKPDSFWKVWYEGRPTIVQISDSGKYFFALGHNALFLDDAEFIEEIPPFGKYYIAFDENDVIWGIGTNPDEAVKSAVKDGPGFGDTIKYKTCECTKEMYEDIEVNGYCHGDVEPYWEYDLVTKLAYYPTKPIRKSVFSQLTFC